MFRALTVTNPRGEKLRLEIRRPELTGFNVMGIDGIGPVKATISTSEIVTSDGVVISGNRVPQRDVTITMAYSPSPGISVESLRHKSYKWFSVKEQVELEFETDDRIARSKGVVESNEVAIFTKQEGSVITVVCPDPWLHSSANGGKQISEFSSTKPAFHFPFQNEGLDVKTLVFGIIEHSTSKVIEYDGEAETGLVMTVEFHGPASGIEIANRDNGQVVYIDTDKMSKMTDTGTGKPIGAVRAGDSVVISSVRRDKYIVFVREGHRTNILNAVNHGLNWPTLRKGYNNFAYTAVSGDTNISVSLSNEVLFAGV